MTLNCTHVHNKCTKYLDLWIFLFFFFLLAKYSGSENIYSMKMSHFVSHSFNSAECLLCVKGYHTLHSTHLLDVSRTETCTPSSKHCDYYRHEEMYNTPSMIGSTQSSRDALMKNTHTSQSAHGFSSRPLTAQKLMKPEYRYAFHVFYSIIHQ